MLNRILPGLIGLAAVAGLSACDKGPEIVPATFTARPSADDLAEAYPAFARMARIPGKVKMRCEYAISGTLQRCRQIAVAPEGLKFEAGVPRLLSKYTVSPQTYDGRPAPAPITFVIAFTPSPPPPPFTGPAPTEAELAMARRGWAFMENFQDRSAQYRASRSVELDRMTAVADIVDRAYAAEGAALTRARAIAEVQVQTPAERRNGPSSTVFSITNEAVLERVSPEYYAAAERAAVLMRAEYCAAWSCSTALPAAAPAE